MAVITILIFLTIFSPEPWLKISFCLIPILMISGVLASAILYSKGQLG